MRKNSLLGGIMIKKMILALFLATFAVVPFTATRADAKTSINAENQIARVNWNINIGGWGGYCGPCYYPYCYPYPPPYAYPYPPPYCGGGIFIW